MIRTAKIEDCQALAEVTVESWQESYAGILPQEHLDSLSIPARKIKWQSSFSETTHQILVCENETTLLGFVSFGPCRDADLSPEITAEIYAIYLRPNFTGQGLGSDLWQAAVDNLKGSGFKELTVWVLEGNIKARRFYESRGCYLDEVTKNATIGGMDVMELRYRCSL